MTSSTPH